MMLGRRTRDAQALVTVVTPTRNRLHYLREAVASVERQTHANWELVVVDDASEDGTAEWLAHLDDARVQRIHLERHLERSAARNRGLSSAQGDFVLFLDDDDRLLPGALATLAAALTDEPAAVSAVGARVEFNEDGHRRRAPHSGYRTTRRIWVDVLAGWWAIPGQFLFRTAALRAAGGWNERFIVAEDQELVLRLSRLGPSVVVGRSVIENRQHPGQWRPKDFVTVEYWIHRSFVEGLTGEDQALAKRVRAARRFSGAALDAVWWARYGEAFELFARAGLAAPRLVASPLLRQLYLTSIPKAAVAAALGPNLGRRVQRAVDGARVRLGRAPNMKMELRPVSGRR